MDHVSPKYALSHGTHQFIGTLRTTQYTKVGVQYPIRTGPPINKKHGTGGLHIYSPPNKGVGPFIQCLWWEPFRFETVVKGPIVKKALPIDRETYVPHITRHRLAITWNNNTWIHIPRNNKSRDVIALSLDAIDIGRQFESRLIHGQANVLWAPHQDLHP